jgi:hypothetical protein
MICEGCSREIYRARFVTQLKKWLCGDCDPGVSIETNVSGSMFPFTTSNIGKDPNHPIEVQSLRHLRKLEAQHGVQSVAWNMNEKNLNPYREDGR